MGDKIWSAALVLALAGCDGDYARSTDVPGFVDDPALCLETWETRLFQVSMDNSEGDSPASDVPVLDTNFGGDAELARDYMAQHGYLGVAAIPDNGKIYFQAMGEPFRDYPATEPGRGVEHACRAAWISGVPFVAVLREGSEIAAD